MTVPLQRDARIPADLVETERSTTVVKESKEIIVVPLQECKLKRFVVKTRKLVEWK